MNSVLRLIFCALLGASLPFVLTAQDNGILSGTVSDAESGQELHDVEILIDESVFGTTTNLDGSFAIAGLPTGTYTVTFMSLGYENHQERVRVAAGETTEMSVVLIPRPLDIGEVLVETERVYSAASTTTIRKFDIRTRPSRTAHDMLQMAPGLIIAQHAGGGKAEQIFLRGFDADHGTDVAIAVDGVPTNMVSHGHGQGYADLHYLIPDVVEAVDVYKGPYFPQFGNLATAGAVQFRTREHIDGSEVRTEGGAFNTARVTTLLQIPLASEHQNAYLAGQFYRTDGPVDQPQEFERFNVFGKFHTHLSPTSKLILTASAFSSGWDASGQIPQRAVDTGTISRFGAIDDLEGGTTSRQELNLQYQLEGPNNSELHLQSYATRYNFKLFSNFTFFLDDADNGDMIEQTDQRQMYGLNSHYRFSHGLGRGAGVTTIGGGYRADDIAVSLWKSPDRVRMSVLNQADIYERNLFLFISEELLISPRFRVQLGLRGDYFTFNVEDQLDIMGLNNGLPHASGYAQKSMLNPKINIAFSPTSAVDLFVNGGTGFHSNDARNVVIAQRIAERVRVYERRGFSGAQIDSALGSRNYDPSQFEEETLPRAIGAEVGFRARLAGRINLSAALWWLDLEREYVFVGDAGTTELSDPTRRIGVDMEARVQIVPWLWGDIDVNLSQGEVKTAPEDANEIPLAPTVTTTGGFVARHPSGAEASLRLRHIGDRPANEDGSVTAEGYTIVNLSMGYRFGSIKLLAAVENLFDSDWNEAQFDTESRLFNETNSVSEIHFTPGNPRNVQLGVSYHF